MHQIFDQWADIYDTVYSYVRDDIPFYVEEARAAGGPVLELGCGTGRVAIPMAAAGAEVVGLDFSAAMLRVARGKAARHPGGPVALRLLRGDMRYFALKRAFKLVVIPFRGFLSLLTVQDQARTLAGVRQHLAPGGRLVFNIFVPDLDMLVQEGDIPFHFRDVTDPLTGTRYVLYHQSHYDNYHQIVNVRVIVEELDQDGRVSSKLYRDFPMRYVHRWEMHHLLQVCGLRPTELYGDFDRSPFDETSTEMVWVAQAAD